MISKPSLRAYVVTLILIIAMSCLILASIWSLHRANEAFSAANERAMRSASNQLKVQAIRIATNTGLASAFPDLSLWTQSPEAPGACLSFHNHLDDAVYHYCKGANHLSAAPSWFSWVYPKLFSLKSPEMQSIDYRDKSYGVLSLHPSHKEATVNAWITLREVAIVSTVVILTTSLLMVFAMNIVIRPSRKIEKSIRTLSNDLSGPPVPDFRINEWQSISLAINDFVQRLRLSQQKSQSLAEQLVRVQEDERRHISRELHDDLGQSLTGLLALSSLLTIRAQKSSPELAETAEKLTVTAQEMMNQMRNILFSLRLTDSLHSGLDSSLHRLIHHWKTRINSPIQLQYRNKAELSELSESAQLNVFRIIQECLHNIYKHSDATQASVEISASPTKQQLHITIIDNGSIEQLEFISNPGFGISGIFERVAMLDGKVDFAIASPHGLVINVTIPIISSHSTTK